MCKTITVDGEGKGVRGGKCGKGPWASLHQTVCHSQLPSLSRQNSTKHPVDVTSPHIARSCRPMLQLHYRRRSDGWTARYVRSVVGCVWEVEGWADMHVGTSPSSLRSPSVSSVSLPSRRPPTVATHGGLSGASKRTDGRTGGRPSTMRRLLIAGIRLHTKTTLLQA